MKKDDRERYIDELLKEAILKKASDLHITVGLQPAFRINGRLCFSAYDKLNSADTKMLFESIATLKQQCEFEKMGEIDFSYFLTDYGRFRVNVFKQCGMVAIVIRIIPNDIPILEDSKYPSVLKTLALKKNGLVLVTGPSGSGKSTTVAAMINLINQSQALHIITMEDPIEYLHKHQKSIIHQREIYTDSKSFSNSLRGALREDPDVIFVGEMRDLETMSIAITAAETGHLVFATLHTPDAIQAVDRIIDAFPHYQQQQIRIQLSMALRGVISQQLLPKKDNSDRIALFEIMIITPAIRNIIREGKTPQIMSHMQTGVALGMQSFDMALQTLLRQNLITKDVALDYASDQKVFN